MPVMHKRKSITSYPDSDNFLNFFFQIKYLRICTHEVKKCWHPISVSFGYTAHVFGC